MWTVDCNLATFVYFGALVVSVLPPAVLLVLIVGEELGLWRFD
jgi:hypothetical protein